MESIVSVLPSAPAPLEAAAPRVSAQVFDACHVGVVLRAVVFVEAVVGVGAMFVAPGFTEWLALAALVTGGALPATLAWLIGCCAFRQQLARLPRAVQWIAGIVLGALCGAYGCGLLALTGFLQPAPWISSAFAGALLSSALVAGLVWRARALAPAATAARLSELQSRIRPHFLFNTLNSAIALVREEPARAEAVLEDLSELFRHALIDQGEAVSLDEEIALARRYLAIEQVRFGDRLRVEWELDPAAGSARLPPLLLQPLVENAVRHGVEPSASGAQVRIVTQRRGASVVVKIDNSVPAGQGKRGHGVTLGNVRDRLALLHDVEGRFQTRLSGGSYRVRIEVPA